MTDMSRRRVLRQSVLGGLAVAASGPLTMWPGQVRAIDEQGRTDEAYRPRFHFTAKSGFTNDPNGLVYYQGEYHLFFQHTEDVGRPMARTQWGHAVSRDLVHWKQLAPVLPAEDGSPSFSGSCVLDRLNTAGFKQGPETPLVAVHTRWGKGQYMAYSRDRGRTFHAYEGNPILTHPNDAKRSFLDSPRDPMVIWYQPDECWVLLMYQNIEGRRGFGVYRSPDLKTWTFASHVPGFYVCPDLFQLPMDGNPQNLHWVIMDWEKYAIGRFDGRSFALDTPMKKIDAASGGGSHVGLGASANQTWKLGTPGQQDHRVVQIAWLRRGQYPGMPFNQQMTFPTQLSLRTFPEGPRLCREPVAEIKRLYVRSHKIAVQEIRPDSPNPLADVKSPCLDVQAVFTLDHAEAGHITLNMRGVDISYDSSSHTVSCLGRSERIKPLDQRLTIRVLVDRTSLEVYIDEGRLVFTFYHYFDPSNRDLTLSVRGGNVGIKSLAVHEL